MNERNVIGGFTAAVYNATTGEIYINSIMGNIIITASAS